MKYPLDFKDSFDKTLLFWMDRFIRYKLTSLSNRLVKDKKTILDVLNSLKKGTSSIEELSLLVKKARNSGLNGINTYFKPLEKLYYFLVDLGLSSMKEIDEEMIVDFLTSSTGGLSDASKKNHRIAIINFFAYIDKQNKENETSHIFGIELKNWGGIRGKAGQKLPVYLTENEIYAFIDKIESYPFRKDVAARNRVLIKIILYTGIRVTEAATLKIKDIIPNEDIYILKITGKGNKSRVVMIKSKHIKKDLDEWLSIRRCDSDLLFCNKKGTSLSQAYISRIVEKILLSAGIRKEKNGAHMLRHTFATLLYLKSKDLVLVQEALGHASLDTSRIYTHFDKDRLYQAVSIMDNIK